jgi:hypothetical protein
MRQKCFSENAMGAPSIEWHAPRSTTDMWLEAILTNDDLLDVLRGFSPLEIRLGETGSLALASPSTVSTILDEGIGVVCDATLHYPVLGIDLPVHMHSLTVLIHPAVVDLPAGAGQALVFTLQIDHTGLVLLPHRFDQSVTKRVNEELVKRHFELSWNFHETLSHVFQLPAALSVASLGLKVTGGKVKITADSLGFAVCFDTQVQKRAANP